MKTFPIRILFAALSIASFTASSDADASSPVKFKVLVRGKKDRPQYIPKPLPLRHPDFFETEHFKVVLGKSNEALPTNSSPELRLKAATVLFHLEKARSYFIETLRSDAAQNLEQLTIRLEHANDFFETGPYANDDFNPQYNNSLAIPAGHNKRTHYSWNREIWFRPVKKIPLKEIEAEDPFNSVIRDVNRTILPGQVDRAIQDFVIQSFTKDGLKNSFIGSVTRQAYTLAAIEAALQLTKYTGKLFGPKADFLDTAMIPELIYHEYAHIALSDRIAITHSTPVNEGLADFFAADLSDSPILAGKIKKYSPWAQKNGDKPKAYSSSFEQNEKATSEYALALLWEVRRHLGPKVARQVIFEATKSLSTYASELRDGLPRALLEACETLCANPMSDRMTLALLFAALDDNLVLPEPPKKSKKSRR